MSHDPAGGVDALVRRFDASFPDEVPAWRTIGREAEHPVVDGSGAMADVAPLLSDLSGDPALAPVREDGRVVALEGPDHAYALEVGRGTIEVITRPCADLFELAQVYEAAMRPLVAAAEARDLVVLGYGIQPVADALPEGMTPKPRYGELLEVVGPGWLWFTLTASDQTHISVGRPEWVAAANLCNLLAPAVVALCANSSVHGGAAAGVCSAREHAMGAIGAAHGRHGMPPRPIESAADHVQRLVDMPCLLERVDGVKHACGRPFAEVLAELPAAAAWDAFLLHEHYVWHSARPRTAHGTLELRAACQQPSDAHDAAAALALALVSAADELARWLADELGPDAWELMRAWHGAVVCDGLAAPPPRPGLLDGVLDRCSAALSARGRGEEALLAPLRARTEAPAAGARRAFEDGGVAGLIEHTRWKPPVRA